MLKSTTSSALGDFRPGQKKLRRLHWWVRAIVTLALSTYLVWRVRAEAGTLRLHLVYPFRLVLALGCAVLGVILSTWLWHILIPPASRVSFRQLLTHYLLGLFWNHFLPGGLGGDAVRVMALRNVSGRTDVAISSVLMARMAGLWSVVLLATGATPLYVQRVGWHTALPLLLIAGGALVVAVGGMAFLLGTPMAVLIRRLPAYLGGWHASLQVYRYQPVRLLQALGLAFAIQGCGVAINALVAQALDLAITPGQLLLCIPLINLTVLIPVSLGGFGVREGSHIYLLGLMGVTATDALILALSVYALLALVTATGAGVCAFLMSPRKTCPDAVGQ